MDSGDEIPALNEPWTMLGAKPTEWGSGFIMFMLCSELFPNVARAMPYLLLVWLGTTVGMAFLRSRFPDEERGVAFFVLTKLGFAPPGIPTPASLQPLWSGCPIRQLRRNAPFDNLDLAQVVNMQEAESEETN